MSSLTITDAEQLTLTEKNNVALSKYVCSYITVQNHDREIYKTSQANEDAFQFDINPYVFDIEPVEKSISLLDYIYDESTWNDYDKLSEIFSELNYQKSFNNLLTEMEVLIPVIEERILQFENPFISLKEKVEVNKVNEELEKLKAELEGQHSLIKSFLNKIYSLFK